MTALLPQNRGSKFTCLLIASDPLDQLSLFTLDVMLNRVQGPGAGSKSDQRAEALNICKVCRD